MNRIISENEIEAFERDGVCILRGIFSPAEVEEMVVETNRLNSRNDNTFMPIFHPHKESAVFRRIMADERIVGSVERIFNGSKIKALQSAMYFKKPGSQGRDVHQENFYHKTERGGTITVWIALDKADRENGTIFAYKGSHREGILPIREIPERLNTETTPDGFKKDRGLCCVVPEQYREKTYIEAEPGDVVFIHNHVIHGSEENLSKDRTRRCFIIVYIRDGLPFEAGKYAGRQPIDVYSFR